MMKTLRIVSVALLLAAIFTACSVIAPESSAAVFYEGEPAIIPFGTLVSTQDRSG